MSKKRKKVKSSSSKRKNNIRVVSGKELSKIEKLGIDLAAGLSKDEVSKIEKQGINIRENNAKFDLRAYSEKFWNSPTGISIKANVEGKPDPYAVKVNVFDEAKKLKNFNELERFIDQFMPGVSAADAGTIITKYIKDHWTLFKILKDPEYHGEVFKLLHWIDTKKGGAPAAYNHRVLRIFAAKTGYKIPPTIKTFQNEITIIKDHFGMSRKKTGKYKREQLEAAAAKLEAKKFPG